MATQAFEPHGDEDLRPRPAVGHMPFPGHRTVATIWNTEAAAKKRERELKPFRKAMEYGLEPDSLKGGK
jgi:hypothetical protein